MQTQTLHQAAPPVSSLGPNLALCSWPTVFWRASSHRKPRFRHLATRVTSFPGASGHCYGQTVWGRFCGNGDAGLAWDWIEIGKGVVAMVDPMRVATNMQLINVDGCPLTAVDAALHINQFVRRLPWQDEVRRLLQTY